MVKRVLGYSILAFWAVMGAWFARREIIPKLYAQPIHRYAVLRPYAETHPGYRMGIFAPDGSTRLGYTETTYHPKDDGDCEIASNTVINLRKHTLVARLGPVRELFKKIEISSNVTIGPDNRLKTFRMACDAVQGFAFGAVRGNSMEVIVNFRGHQWKRIVPVTEEDVMSSGYMAVGALPALRVGQMWRINVLDPLTFKFTTAMARVTKRTRIQLRGHWYRVFEVELAGRGPVAKAWVGDSGDVLKEEAFQIVLIREPLPHEGGAGRTMYTSPPAAH